MSDIVEWKSGHPLRYLEPITPLVVADVLDAAAQVLQRVGWYRGGMYGPDGSMCVLASVRAACGGDAVLAVDGSWERALLWQAREVLVQRVASIREFRSVPYWNDHGCGGLADATSTLTGLAEKLRQEEADSRTPTK